jgi:hypothetical protein
MGAASTDSQADAELKSVGMEEAVVAIKAFEPSSDALVLAQDGDHTNPHVSLDKNADASETKKTSDDDDSKEKKEKRKINYRKAVWKSVKGSFAVNLKTAIALFSFGLTLLLLYYLVSDVEKALDDFADERAELHIFISSGLATGFFGGTLPVIIVYCVKKWRLRSKKTAPSSANVDTDAAADLAPAATVGALMGEEEVELGLVEQSEGESVCEWV